MIYGRQIPENAIGAAVLAAASEWDTEAVTWTPTALEDDDTIANVWVHEVVGQHAHGWNLFGRESLAVVDLATLAVTLTEGES